MTELARNAVFARVAARPIPRVLRMMRVATDLGYRTTFCGALREEHLERAERLHDADIVRLGPYFPLLNGRRPLLYLRSILSFNRALYRYLKDTGPGIVHASDIETMPAAIFDRLRRGNRLIYNIHDNLAQRYNVPAPVAFMLNVTEGICVRLADVAVVPEEFRRTALPRWCRRDVAVIRNTPEDRGFSAPLFEGSTIRIFFAGWLDWGRGLRALLGIAEKNPDIELRIAGEGAPEIVDEIQGHPRITYLGFVDHDTIMEETRRCHYVAALYDPARPINRFAASNKLAEALSVGRPVIVNSELKIAQQLANQGCLVTTAYESAAGLADTLRDLFSDRERYQAACAAARQVYEREYAWAPVREGIERVLAADDSGS